MYICITYIHTYVHKCVCIYACIYPCVTYSFRDLQSNCSDNNNVFMHICTYMLVCTYNVCVYLHIYMLMCMQTYLLLYKVEKPSVYLSICTLWHADNSAVAVLIENELLEIKAVSLKITKCNFRSPQNQLCINLGIILD